VTPVEPVAVTVTVGETVACPAPAPVAVMVTVGETAAVPDTTPEAVMLTETATAVAGWEKLLSPMKL
jgi:hypothetical protein